MNQVNFTSPSNSLIQHSPPPTPSRPDIMRQKLDFLAIPPKLPFRCSAKRAGTPTLVLQKEAVASMTSNDGTERLDHGASANEKDTSASIAKYILDLTSLEKNLTTSTRKSVNARGA
ncbi:hypothetical protein ACHAWO_005069 [Cyclotella atomus]|uniref:Uncharacterized protein n=1 Tax=Cyclotella atomus TaxID=382360 RepID=A0ABD3P7C2_9STRA